MFGSDNATSADNQQERPGLRGIHPWYIAGFVDGEGSFHIAFNRRSDLQFNWGIIPEFRVNQDQSRSIVLYDIQKYFHCGQVMVNHRRRENDATLVYRVRNRVDLLSQIIPFFQKYPLRSTKARDYKVFVTIVRALAEEKHRTWDGFCSIVEQAYTMNGEGRYRKVEMNTILSRNPQRLYAWTGAIR
jgi:hypothetical protein